MELAEYVNSAAPERVGLTMIACMKAANGSTSAIGACRTAAAGVKDAALGRVASRRGAIDPAKMERTIQEAAAGQVASRMSACGKAGGTKTECMAQGKETARMTMGKAAQIEEAEVKDIVEDGAAAGGKEAMKACRSSATDTAAKEVGVAQCWP